MEKWFPLAASMSAVTPQLSLVSGSYRHLYTEERETGEGGGVKPAILSHGGSHLCRSTSAASSLPCKAAQDYSIAVSTSYNAWQ